MRWPLQPSFRFSAAILPPWDSSSVCLAFARYALNRILELYTLHVRRLP
jgi:hypothetical protein